MTPLSKREWTKWSFLGFVGRSRAVKLSALFPTIGYVLLMSDALLGKLCGQASLICGPQGHMPWKLVVLYFALFILGVGALLFLVWCPRVHAEYANEVDFIERERFLWLGDRKAEMLSSLRRQRDSYASQMSEGDAAVSESLLSGISEINDANVHDALTCKYRIYDWYRPRARVVVAVFFGTGLVLLAIPSVTTMIQITCRVTTGQH